MNHLLTYLSLSMTVFLIGGCCKPGDEPKGPYGNADDVSRYDGSEGYKSIDFTYYCKNGKYISVTYIRKDACSDYSKDSEYTSSGICSHGKVMDNLRGLSANAKLRYLISRGFKVDTVSVGTALPSGPVQVR